MWVLLLGHDVSFYGSFLSRLTVADGLVGEEWLCSARLRENDFQDYFTLKVIVVEPFLFYVDVLGAVDNGLGRKQLNSKLCLTLNGVNALFVMSCLLFILCSFMGIV